MVGKKIAYKEIQTGQIIPGLFWLYCTSYLMAFFILDDTSKYGRGVSKTIPRVKVATKIFVRYAFIYVVYKLLESSTQDSELTIFAKDILSLICILLLSNFLLTVALYAYTYYSSKEDINPPNEGFDFMDVIDMRKVRMNAPLSKLCSAGEFEGSEASFRDQGTLQTIPLGIGELPTESLFGKLGWYIETMTGEMKEAADPIESVKTEVQRGLFWGLGAGVLGFFAGGPVGGAAAAAAVGIGSTSAGDAIAGAIPGSGAIASALPLGLYSWFSTKLSGKPGLETAQSPLDLVDFTGNANMAKLLVVFIILNAFSSQSTGSTVLTTIKDPAKAVCLPGVLARATATTFLGIPDQYFKASIKQAAPDRTLVVDYEYYANTMQTIREHGGFCTPLEWKLYIQWLWQRGDIPNPSQMTDEQIDRLLLDMSNNKNSWPATVAKTSMMYAYNMLKKEEVDRMLVDKKDGITSREEAEKAWLFTAKYSVVHQYLQSYQPSARYSIIQDVFDTGFYENPRYMEGSDTTEVEDKNKINIKSFKKHRRDYVTQTLIKPLQLFQRKVINDSLNDLKKLCVDSEHLKQGVASSSPGQILINHEYIKKALYVGEENHDATGRYRMLSVIPFLSSTGARNNTKVAIDFNDSSYCASVYPGPPALTEDRQYRFNGQTGLFTLLPIWEGWNKNSSETGVNQNFNDFLKWTGISPTDRYKWSDVSGGYVKI